VPSLGETREPPPFFRDLNLDQIVAKITARWTEYDLVPFFNSGLADLDAIRYRQEVMRELERVDLRESLAMFSAKMHTMRQLLALVEHLDYPYERARQFLNAIQVYSDAVAAVLGALRPIELRSRGMRAFRDYLEVYVESPGFGALRAEMAVVLAALSAIRYGLRIKGDRVTVLRECGTGDYTQVIEQTFEKFRRGAVRDHMVSFADPGRLNHIEAQILDRVARLHPRVFAALDVFCARHAEYLDEPIVRFDREVQFYMAYLGYIGALQRAGLPFCEPQLSDTSKDERSSDAFDLALASRLVAEQGTVVRNGFHLSGSERILVVSGPNQGGKTTFARMFGQLHYLASLGCPVPGTEARLFLCDQLLTHFERQEDVASLRGKLQDDLIRVHDILGRATPRSIVILNELFGSTTVEDALFLSREVMGELVRLDLLAVCVTFLDELATFSETVVSLVSGVDATDPTIRTFRLERRAPDGLAYALAIAEKYRVTYHWLRARLSG